VVILHPITPFHSLKLRFLKNKQDCIFTILALLPGLGAQITEDMDVEGITQVLQGRSRHREDNGLSSREPSVASNTSNQSLSNQNAPSLPTLNASGEPIPHAATGSHSVVPSEANEDQPIPGAMAESSLSWVEQFTAASGESNGARSPSIAEAQLSDSMISGTLSTTSEVVRVSIFDAQRIC
jgi:peroxin-3